jgi:hypothetical protein
MRMRRNKKQQELDNNGNCEQNTNQGFGDRVRENVWGVSGIAKCIQ